MGLRGARAAPRIELGQDMLIPMLIEESARGKPAYGIFPAFSRSGSFPSKARSRRIPRASRASPSSSARADYRSSAFSPRAGRAAVAPGQRGWGPRAPPPRQMSQGRLPPCSRRCPGRSFEPTSCAWTSASIPRRTCCDSSSLRPSPSALICAVIASVISSKLSLQSESTLGTPRMRRVVASSLDDPLWSGPREGGTRPIRCADVRSWGHPVAGLH